MKMLYSKRLGLTGLALILASFLGEKRALAEPKPGEVDLSQELSPEEKLKLCTDYRDDQKKRGKIFGTNPECTAHYSNDHTMALCLKPEEAAGFTAKGFTATAHPWSDYTQKSGEACSGKEVCTAVSVPDRMYQCANGEWRGNRAACPEVKVPEPVVKYQCQDGTEVDDLERCPLPRPEPSREVLLGVSGGQSYSAADKRTTPLEARVLVEVVPGTGLFLGPYFQARLVGDTELSSLYSGNPQYIATPSGDNLVGSQSNSETITSRGNRYIAGVEGLLDFYPGRVIVGPTSGVGVSREVDSSEQRETTRYWAQTQDGTVFQEGVPGPTGPAVVDGSSETRYGIDPRVGLMALVPAYGPLAVGVGVNGSYHHVFGNRYSNDNWGVDGSVNLNFFFGGDERK